MIIAFITPPVLASMVLAWAYAHRNDDRPAEPRARHLAA